LSRFLAGPFLRLTFIAFSCCLESAIAFSSSAERTDQLLLECQGKQPGEIPEAGLLSCSRYIDGILDMQAVMIGLGGSFPLFCLPNPGVSVDEAMKIFIKWADQHPGELHKPARVSVVVALNAAFPCR
jgi:Ssp1 endopeptidase immunity protein Rap1a